ncbi:MAG: hypothetical protein KJO21_02770 [Verrucomicrobiae bacterium]|nr:hypothetical protein [Verrucomicrobiae bacterium]NNJ41840.1 hypothetical protein [Akkermansiaceae bacterium]
MLSLQNIPIAAIIGTTFLHTLTAGIIAPTAINYTVPAGSNDTTNPFTDDVFLDSIVFASGTVYSAGGGIRGAVSSFVSLNRNNINAERGDNDDDSDGDTDPFTRVGLDPMNYESTDPSFQDRSITSAFSTRSLVEGVDGESLYRFNIIFNAGISDNDAGVDSMPEVVLFERGNNDTTTVKAIIGGTYNAPVYAPLSTTINSGNLTYTGLDIDTYEIGSAQSLNAGGFDANDFGTTSTIWGLEIESNGGDFYGVFAVAEDPSTQLDSNVPQALINPDAVPEPHTSMFIGITSLCLLCRRSRK